MFSLALVIQFLTEEKFISNENRKQIEISYSTQKVASQFANIYDKKIEG